MEIVGPNGEADESRELDIPSEARGKRIPRCQILRTAAHLLMEDARHLSYDALVSSQSPKLAEAVTTAKLQMQTQCDDVGYAPSAATISHAQLALICIRHGSNTEEQGAPPLSCPAGLTKRGDRCMIPVDADKHFPAQLAGKNRERCSGGSSWRIEASEIKVTCYGPDEKHACGQGWRESQDTDVSGTRTLECIQTRGAPGLSSFESDDKTEILAALSNIRDRIKSGAIKAEDQDYCLVPGSRDFELLTTKIDQSIAALEGKPVGEPQDLSKTTGPSATRVTKTKVAGQFVYSYEKTNTRPQCEVLNKNDQREHQLKMYSTAKSSVFERDKGCATVMIWAKNPDDLAKLASKYQKLTSSEITGSTEAIIVPPQKPLFEIKPETHKLVRSIKEAKSKKKNP